MLLALYNGGQLIKLKIVGGAGGSPQRVCKPNTSVKATAHPKI